jgi:hypothetical protein
MKSIFSKLSLAAVLCVAASTQAQAANVYYTSSYDTAAGQWVLRWSDLPVGCDFSLFFPGVSGQWTLTVDGVVQPAVPNSGTFFNGMGGNGSYGTVSVPGAEWRASIGVVVVAHELCLRPRHDQIGAAPVVSAPTQAVPTLTEWGMMAMGSLIAGFGALRLRRRERSTEV